MRVHRSSLLAVLAALAACSHSATSSGGGPTDGDGGGSGDIPKIQHVVIIMQENRSFDHYFGTFPGVDGISMDDAGVPLACLPQRDGGCVRPFHDPDDVNGGGPHGQAA